MTGDHEPIHTINSHRSRLLQVGLPGVAFVALLSGWQYGVTVTNTSPLVLPSPLAIADAFVTSWGSYLTAMGVTAATAAGGLAIGIGFGVIAAYALVEWPRVGTVFLPYIVALRIAPLVAIAPLLVVWLGDGIGVRILLVSTMTVFPITIASYNGLRSVPSAYLDLAQSVNAAPPTVFLRIRAPHALPSVVAGLKLAGALAVIGAVVAEFITLRAGIGYRVFAASNALRVPEMFAALACLSVLGIGFFAIPAVVERRVHR